MKRLLLAGIISVVGIGIGFYFDRCLRVVNPPSYWMIGYLVGLYSGIIMKGLAK